MDRLTELRNAIFRVCADYDADDGIRAMASALTENSLTAMVRYMRPTLSPRSSMTS